MIAAFPDGHRSTLWGRLRSILASRPRPPCRHARTRQSSQRRSRRLAAGLCAVPGRCRLCLAWGDARRCRCRRPSGLRVSVARSDHLGEATFHAEPRRLSLEARMLLVVVREGKTSHWTGDRTQTTVWEFPNNNPFGSPRREESWGHGTQKPVEAMRRPIVNNSRLGELVYDPFLGSGTSLIAAEMTGRLCFGLELCPAYVDVIVRRWQAFTGRTAVLQTSGQSFDERAASQDRSGGCGHG